MLIPLDDIAVIDRARRDLGDVQGLAASIKANGQITPIAVRPSRPDDNTDSPWVLVAGGRRYAAHVLNNASTIKAENLEEMSPLQHTIVELEENLARKQLEWVEEVFLKERIHQLKQSQATGGWSQKQTAREIGEDPGNLSKDLALAKAIRADPSLRQATSKKGAIRQMEFKQEIAQRVANISTTNTTTLRDKLVLADMRDFVRTLQTDSVNLVFMDWPFGIEYNFEKGDPSKYKDTQNALLDLISDMIPQLMRVTKRNGWIAMMMGSTNYEHLKGYVEDCCATHYDYRIEGQNKCGSHLDSEEKCYFPRCEDPEWIWFRPNSRNPSMHPERHAQNQYEKICVVNMGAARLVQTDKGNVLVHDAVYTDRIHEMQRPHDLCRDIIQRFTLYGELVVDFCMGSGSALAAAADLGRDFKGCDLNPNNIEPAMTLVAQYLKAKP